MPELRALWMRLGGLVGGRQTDGEFEAELESHERCTPRTAFVPG